MGRFSGRFVSGQMGSQLDAQTWVRVPRTQTLRALGLDLSAARAAYVLIYLYPLILLYCMVKLDLYEPIGTYLELPFIIVQQNDITIRFMKASDLFPNNSC